MAKTASQGKIVSDHIQVSFNFQYVMDKTEFQDKIVLDHTQDSLNHIQFAME